LLRQLIKEAPKERGEVPNEDPLRGALTSREIEVLQLTARGYTNLQIARALLISVSTVKKHLRSVVSKLGVSDRTQATVRALELGVLVKNGSNLAS
jgi:NarL family two-component system response regulator LiaR